MRVVFYSPFGGTGKTTALANVASELVRGGKKVGAIDLDLDMGGLREFFGISIKDIEKDLTDIVIRYEISTYYECVIEKSWGVNDGKLFFFATAPFLDTVRYQNERKWIKWFGALELFYRSASYLVIKAVEAFYNDYKPDFLILDSQSGINESSSVAISCADLVVLFTPVKRNSLLKVKQLLVGLQAHNIPVIFATSPILSPAMHSAELERAAAYLGHNFDCVIPYDENMYWEGKSVTRRKLKAELKTAYVSLMKKILEISQLKKGG